MPHRPQSGASTRVTPVRGRDDETRLLRTTIDSGAPLITIVGPPGVGKTRLVQHVIARAPVLDASRLDGLTGFDELADRALIALIEHEGDSLCPIVFDGLDTADPPVDAITAFVDRHEHLQLIVTRRSPLGAHGETIHRLTPLDLPTQTGQALHHQDRWPALQCFLDHARRADPTFEITPDNARDALVVLRSTGGLPLAIELTARWLHLIPVQELAIRAVDLITSTPPGADHLARTLHATIAHLSDRQVATATAFARFHGPVAIDVVTEVLGTEVDWADLGVLANLGLIFPVERDGKAWFGMSPITARHLIATRPNPDQRRRYQVWLLDLIETNAPDLVTLDGARAMTALSPYANGLPPLPAIFDDPDELANAALHLSRFWENNCQHQEAADQLLAAAHSVGRDHPQHRWLGLLGARYQILSDSSDATTTLASLASGSPAAEALAAAELVLYHCNRYEPIPSDLMSRAVELARSVAPSDELHPEIAQRIVEIPSRLANAKLAVQSHRLGREHFIDAARRVLDELDTRGDHFHRLSTLQILAEHEILHGDLELAEGTLRELIMLASSIGSSYDLVPARLLAVALKIRKGGLAEAADESIVALEFAERLGLSRQVDFARLGAALLQAEIGRYANARSLMRRSLRSAAAQDLDVLASAALTATAGIHPGVGVPDPVRSTLIAVARQLSDRDDASYPGPWDRRIASLPIVESDISTDAAIEQAVSHLESVTHGSKGGLSVLTRRENEVLELVRQGMTDRDIADQLYVSVRTINSHVSTILRKTGVSSRSEAAALLEDDGC